jgi:hypothetical protein
MGKTKVYADYFKNYGEGNKSGATAADGSSLAVKDAYNILGGGLQYTFDSNWKVIGEYYQNKADDVNVKYNGDDPTATIARVAYKGAVASKPHTYGLSLDWVKFEGNVFPYAFSGPMYTVDPSKIGKNFNHNDGYKAFNAEFDYTLAKNVTFNAMYQFNIKTLKDTTYDTYDHYVRAQINYLF